MNIEKGYYRHFKGNLYEVTGNDVTSGAVSEEAEEQDDNAFITIKGKNWYPDYFRTMIDTNTIDLTLLHPSYKFFIILFFLSLF